MGSFSSPRVLGGFGHAVDLPPVRPELRAMNSCESGGGLGGYQVGILGCVLLRCIDGISLFRYFFSTKDVVEAQLEAGRAERSFGRWPERSQPGELGEWPE